MSMKVLVVGNEKGGTGKTAIATQMAYFAAEQGVRVLVVDLDPQGTCTSKFLAGEADKGVLMAYHLFGVTLPAERNAWQTDNEGISLIPAHRLLDRVPERPVLTEDRPAALLRALNGFDLCVIDTPPTRGKLFRAALRAADYLLTPFEPKDESIHGISALLDTIRAVRTMHNPGLKHIGILANRVPPHSVTAAKLLSELRTVVGGLLLPDVIYERAAITAALAARRPVWRTERGEARSPAAEEVYTALKSVWERMR